MNKHIKRAKAALNFGTATGTEEGAWDRVCAAEMAQTGSSPTGDAEFDKVGYRIVRNICPPELLVTPVPDVRGQLNYFDKNLNNFTHNPMESQVPGSVARYKYPFFYEAYTTVKHNIEKAISTPLYKTYYYDRFYFPGEDLKYHCDRDACELSCTIHCSTNLKDVYPVYIKAVDGSVTAADLKPGDGLVYKGCERPHWRLKMPGVKRQKIRNLLGKDELYYHQIFMHFVLANGSRSHFAGDSNKNNW